MNHYATRGNFEMLKSLLSNGRDNTLNIEDNSAHVGITNGEKLIEIFPEIEVRGVSESEFITFTFDHVVGNAVERRWWNAPYERSKK